jgi:type II secretory pathway component PulK
MRGRRGGFVLVAALWLLVALGAVGLDAALRSRTRRLAAANLVDETRAMAAAVAGTEYARSRLTAAMLDRAEELRSDALRRARTDAARSRVSRQSVRSFMSGQDPLEDPWREPELLVEREMLFGDARYGLRLRDTGAALNLNTANEETLRDFFAQGMRVDYADADHLAQAILDWRDEDEIPRLDGGEREQYLKERMPVLPANRDFAELDEVRHVMGMTQELYEQASPYLTLIGSGRINVNAAPEPVLLALPGMTPGAAQELIRMRESGYVPRSGNELRQLLPFASGSGTQADRARFDRLTTYTTNEVEIISVGRVEGSPIRVEARVVVGRSNSGAVVLWRRVE